MFAFFVVLAFIAIVVSPAILIAIQRARARNNDL
jgi:hypothetical protein